MVICRMQLINIIIVKLIFKLSQQNKQIILTSQIDQSNIKLQNEIILR